MELAYIDTSVLAKWYLPEPGSENFAAWMGQQEDICISSLTITEFRCLFWPDDNYPDTGGELLSVLEAYNYCLQN